MCCTGRRAGKFENGHQVVLTTCQRPTGGTLVSIASDSTEKIQKKRKIS